MNPSRTAFPAEKGRGCRGIPDGVLLFLLLILILLPLALVLAQSIWSAGSFHPEDLLPDRSGAEFWTLLAQTVWLGATVSGISLLITFPLAFLSVKTNVGNRRWLDALLLIPFMTPPYISAMSWVEFMQKNGFLEQLIPISAACTPGFFSFGGLAAVMSLQVFPVIYLLLKDTLRGIGNHMDEAGAVHGATFSYRLRHIYLPLVLPGCSVGLLLIFTKTISEFGAPATLGRTIHYNVMTTSIYQSVSSWPVDFGKAAGISFWLMAACLLIWKVQNFVTSRHPFRAAKSKEQYSARYRLKGWKRILAWIYIGLILLLAIGIPYFSVFATSLMKIQGNGLRLTNLTAGHYLGVLSSGTEGLTALMTSLGVSLLAATLAVLAGFLIGLRLAGGTGGWFQQTVEGIGMLPNTVPGIVLLLGMIFLWNSPLMPLHLYDTYAMVVLAYVVLFLPYAVQYAQSGISQTDRSLWEAGKLFSGRKPYLLIKIILPLAGPHLLSAWVLIFVFSMRELVASLLILPPGMQTAASYIYAQFDQGSVSDGMALAVISVALTSAVYALINSLIHSSAGRHRRTGFFRRRISENQ